MSERSPKVRKTGSPGGRAKKVADKNKSDIEYPTSEIKELQTANSKQQTEPMEVHHHPQLEHKPKPWKEYLLEGLMIFVAVTMGFFAESLREHIARNEKERQVIESLMSGIKKDTAKLGDLIRIYMPAHNRWADSAEKDINSLTLAGNERRITRAIINASNWNTYAPPEMALNIVKDAGAFDLVEKDEVKTHLLSFSTKINEYIKYSAFLTEVEHHVDTASTSFLSRKDQRILVAKLYLNNAKNSNGFVTMDDIPAEVKFKTYNKAVFLGYMRKLDQVDNLLNDALGEYERIFSEETKLLSVLKHEYHLGDE
ncbi:MAG TPA: hypothetical protein VK668_01350 [Mucilaginibacter sp.]|nr:hypothetical protein [Mucilaginibacter sp.]